MDGKEMVSENGNDPVMQTSITRQNLERIFEDSTRKLLEWDMSQPMVFEEL